MAGLTARIGLITAVLALWVSGAEARAAAPDIDARLKQAAQHFADLEDGDAKVILEELSAQGVAEADVLLGYLFSDPLFEGRNYEAAVVAFEQAAAAGDEEGIFQLAESRFWPDYSDWTLTPDEKAVRLSAEDAFGLLMRTVRDRPSAWGEAGARYWRLAWLCTFGGYDCGKDVAVETVRKAGQQLGNLRMIQGSFQILDPLLSIATNEPAGGEQLQAVFGLSLASADPFVGVIVASGSIVPFFERDGSCPDPRSLDAALRLLALESDVVVVPGEWRSFRRCLDAGQEAALREDLAKSLDKLIRDYSNQDSWHLRTCYRDPQADTFGDCLIHAVRDHYFACTKLSLIDYFRSRYKIYYADSDRYARCREAMISARRG